MSYRYQLENQVSVSYNKVTVSVYFLFVLFFTGIPVLAFFHASVTLGLLYLCFIYLSVLWTFNFIGLFSKKEPLAISRDSIKYTPYDLLVNIKDIRGISYRYSRGNSYIEINLRDNINKYDLPESLFGKIMITGGAFNYTNKKKIIILTYGLNINEKKFKALLASVGLKTTY